MRLGHMIQKGERCQAGLYHNPRRLFCGGSAEPVKRQDPRRTSWQITVPTEALYPESTKNLTSQEGHDPMTETGKALKGQHSAGHDVHVASERLETLCSPPCLRRGRRVGTMGRQGPTRGSATCSLPTDGHTVWHGHRSAVLVKLNALST